MTPFNYVPQRPVQTLGPSAIPSLPSSSEGGSDDDIVSAIEESLYRDNSRVTPEEVEAEVRSRRKAPRKEPTFPLKLHRLLSDQEAEDAITWLPHGRAWKFVSQERFESTILPRHFEHGNISSFMRQVNGWGFKRIAKGVDENAYYHELFLRGMPHLCDKMSRSKTSPKRDAVSSMFSVTPDFYRISQDYPLPDQAGEDIQASQAPQRNSAQDSNHTLDVSTVTTEALPLRQQSPNRTSNNELLAREAIQEYILHDFAETQRTLPSIQAFQQHLQARNDLLNNLRNIANQTSHSSVPIPTTYSTE